TDPSRKAKVLRLSADDRCSGRGRRCQPYRVHRITTTLSTRLVDLAQDATRIARRQHAFRYCRGDDAAGANDGPRTDTCARADDGAAAHPYIVANLHFTSQLQPRLALLCA